MLCEELFGALRPLYAGVYFQSNTFFFSVCGWELDSEDTPEARRLWKSNACCFLSEQRPQQHMGQWCEVYIDIPIDTYVCTCLFV